MRSSRGSRAGIAWIALLVPWIASAAEDAPDWLKPLASVSLPQYGPKVTTAVLLNEEHTTVAESGKLTTTTRTAIRILASQGVDAIFYDQYDAPSSKVRDFRAWMISPSGSVKRYGKDEIMDVACVDNDVYNECRRRMVSGKRDSQAGSTFAYESTIEYQSFSNQLRFRFQDFSPVRIARFIVTLPQGWTLKSSSFNGAPAEPAASGGNYTWEMANLPWIESEPSSPSPLTLVPWVGVNLLGTGANNRAVLSWPDAAKLMTQLNEGQAEANEAIAAKARSLVEGAKTELEKIGAIGRFLQKINYVSIQTNVSKGGGYRPHPAGQTFEKLYGDCKDKANLMRAMLRAAGITAYPVAIFSGDRTHVRPEWPSLGVFNHAISAIRVGAETTAPAVLDDPKLGRLLFFDPTDPYVEPGYLPDHEQGSPALVATAEAGDLVRVPASPPVAAAHERQVDAVLGADGSITGTFVDTRSGEQLAGAAGMYRANSKTDYVKIIEGWVGRSVPGALTTGVEAQDEPGRFVLKGRFASPGFAQRPQARMLIFKAAILSHGDLRLTGKTRKFPIVVETDVLSETVRIRLPAEFKVDELPEPVRIGSPFGKFEASWKAEAGAIVFRRMLEMAAQTVPPSQYPELRRFLDEVTSSEEAAVVLVR